MWTRIENGTVAEITATDPTGRFHPSLVWIPCPDGIECGWIYANGEFSPPPPPSPPVPERVTRRQGCLALLDAGLLDEVEAKIAAIADLAQQRAAQIEYEAATWERSNSFLQSMWESLGGTPEGLDQMFIAAASK
ncbi:hypothetical protein [Bordetella sp. 2513F-2]